MQAVVMSFTDERFMAWPSERWGYNMAVFEPLFASGEGMFPCGVQDLMSPENLVQHVGDMDVFVMPATPYITKRCYPSYNRAQQTLPELHGGLLMCDPNKRHANVMTVYGVIPYSNGTLDVIVSNAGDMDLDEYLAFKATTSTPAEMQAVIASTMLQVCSGMQHIHEVYRAVLTDLKDPNVRVNSSTGQVQIIDLTLCFMDEMAPCTPVLCSPYYAAPEVALRYMYITFYQDALMAGNQQAVVQDLLGNRPELIPLLGPCCDPAFVGSLTPATDVFSLGTMLKRTAISTARMEEAAAAAGMHAVHPAARHADSMEMAAAAAAATAAAAAAVPAGHRVPTSPGPSPPTMGILASGLLHTFNYDPSFLELLGDQPALQQLLSRSLSASPLERPSLRDFQAGLRLLLREAQLMSAVQGQLAAAAAGQAAAEAERAAQAQTAAAAEAEHKARAAELQAKLSALQEKLTAQTTAAAAAGQQDAARAEQREAQLARLSSTAQQQTPAASGLSSGDLRVQLAAAEEQNMKLTAWRQLRSGQQQQCGESKWPWLLLLLLMDVLSTRRQQ